MSIRHFIPAYIVFGLLSVAMAQSPQDAFVSFDNHPYGPGDRGLDMKIKLLPGETTANIEVWVLYSDDKADIVNATLGGSAPQGRAKLGAVNSEAVVSASFIFPHHSNPRPNASDRNQKTIRSGEDVAYKVVKKKGRDVVTSDIVGFVMPDKLTIVNIGDSYGSGEGAPYSSGAKWDDELCHRSGNSGQARAVATMKRENPGMAIAFLNVACSGAEIAEGFLQPQKKKTWFGESEVHQVPVPPQLDQVRDWLDANDYEQLNILMISGGGNDVGFGTYVEDYYVFPGNLATDTRAKQNLESTIDGTIPNSYTALKAVIDDMFTYDQVFVSEYPDPVRDQSGQFCDFPPFSPRAEFEAIYNSFLVRINTKIKQTVTPFKNWTFVDGLMNASRRNGMCSSTQWFNDMLTTFLVQQDPYGMVHPNKLGHEKIYQPAYERHLRGAIKDIRKAAAIKAAKERARQKVLANKTDRRMELARRKAAIPRLSDAVARQVQLLSTTKRATSSGKRLDAATIQDLQNKSRSAKIPSFGPDNRMPNDSER